MQSVDQKRSIAAEGLATPPDNTRDASDWCVQQPSPSNAPPKNVAFELLLDQNSKVRARIPMRVQIFPHDTTDSIVTTVKNFYGIYDGVASGVSFEDENGTTLIARYENLRNNMTVYVRVIPAQVYGNGYDHGYYGQGPLETRKRPTLGEPFQPLPHSSQGRDYRPPSRPGSRTRKPSASPSGRGRRSASQTKGSSKPGSRGRGSFLDDAVEAYSDSEDGNGSVTGARKARSEQFASSDISTDNIVQENRRKRPKFESSELPLFAPPQVPLTASTSSISPQRRSTGQEEPSPFARPSQRPFGNRPPLPSPQSYGYSDQGYNQKGSSVYSTPIFGEQGGRHSAAQGSYPNSGGRPSASGVLPTPDPTIASCISDEDVAMQLIRLGDASNFSHGRNSTSTLDDAFSGAADASSTGATSDGEFSENEEDDEFPPRSRQRVDSSPLLHGKRTYKHPSYDSAAPSDDERDQDYIHSDIKNEDDDDVDSQGVPRGRKTKAGRSRSTAKSSSGSSRVTKRSRGSAPRKPKATAAGAKSSVTASLQGPAAPRKNSSTTANPLPPDEEDLSTKPRCQRCRKSKKGCDRQRPCGRCRDAGIGREGCISEDEGNGRKGRYGRHMGVTVKKAAEAAAAAAAAAEAGSSLGTSSAALTTADKSRKRKR